MLCRKTINRQANTSKHKNKLAFQLNFKTDGWIRGFFVTSVPASARQEADTEIIRGMINTAFPLISHQVIINKYGQKFWFHNIISCPFMGYHQNLIGPLPSNISGNYLRGLNRESGLPSKFSWKCSQELSMARSNFSQPPWVSRESVGFISCNILKKKVKEKNFNFLENILCKNINCIMLLSSKFVITMQYIKMKFK